MALLMTPPLRSHWIDVLTQETNTWLTLLSQEEAQRVLRRSDLDRLLAVLQAVPAGVRCSEQPGCDLDRVTAVFRAFYLSLFTTIAPQFERLHDPLLREKARKTAASQIARIYSAAHALVALPASGFGSEQEVGAILTHTPQEVCVLLNCPEV